MYRNKITSVFLIFSLASGATAAPGCISERDVAGESAEELDGENGAHTAEEKITQAETKCRNKVSELLKPWDRRLRSGLSPNLAVSSTLFKYVTKSNCVRQRVLEHFPDEKKLNEIIEGSNIYVRHMDPDRNGYAPPHYTERRMSVLLAAGAALAAAGAYLYTQYKFQKNLEKLIDCRGLMQIPPPLTLRIAFRDAGHGRNLNEVWWDNSRAYLASTSGVIGKIIDNLAWARDTVSGGAAEPWVSRLISALDVAVGQTGSFIDAKNLQNALAATARAVANLCDDPIRRAQVVDQLLKLVASLEVIWRAGAGAA